MKALYGIAVCIVAILSGCNTQPPSAVSGRLGQKCNVQFRRDALGAATPNGISPKTDEYNGTTMGLNGTLKKAGADWILLSDGDWEFMIPTHAVLYLKFFDPTKK